MHCPTVRVKSDVAPGGYVVINESDLTDAHELFDGPPAGEHTSSSDVQIPDGWESLHWKRQVKLAKELGREGEPSGDEAKAFIAVKLAERAAK